jgi:hypothetical protein
VDNTEHGAKLSSRGTLQGCLDGVECGLKYPVFRTSYKTDVISEEASQVRGKRRKKWMRVSAEGQIKRCTDGDHIQHTQGSPASPILPHAGRLGGR